MYEGLSQEEIDAFHIALGKQVMKRAAISMVGGLVAGFAIENAITKRRLLNIKSNH